MPAVPEPEPKFMLCLWDEPAVCDPDKFSTVINLSRMFILSVLVK